MLWLNLLSLFLWCISWGENVHSIKERTFFLDIWEILLPEKSPPAIHVNCLDISEILMTCYYYYHFPNHFFTFIINLSFCVTVPLRLIICKWSPFWIAIQLCVSYKSSLDFLKHCQQRGRAKRLYLWYFTHIQDVVLGGVAWWLWMAYNHLLIGWCACLWSTV